MISIDHIKKIRIMLGIEENQGIGPDKRREVFYGDNNLVKLIGTGKATITNAEADKPIIGTYGLANCIAILGYNPKTKKAFLSHNIDKSKLEELNNPLIKEIGNNNLEIYLIGGNGTYKENLTAIYDYLNLKLKEYKLKEEDVLKPNDPKKMGKSIIFDTRDGKVYCHHGVGNF